MSTALTSVKPQQTYHKALSTLITSAVGDKNALLIIEYYADWQTMHLHKHLPERVFRLITPPSIREPFNLAPDEWKFSLELFNIEFTNRGKKGVSLSIDWKTVCRCDIYVFCNGEIVNKPKYTLERTIALVRL